MSSPHRREKVLPPSRSVAVAVAVFIFSFLHFFIVFVLPSVFVLRLYVDFCSSMFLFPGAHVCLLFAFLVFESIITVLPPSPSSFQSLCLSLLRHELLFFSP